MKNKWVDCVFGLFRYAIKAHKMSYNDCMEMDIDDYLDYLEFDIVRSPLEEMGPDIEDFEE